MKSSADTQARATKHSGENASSAHRSNSSRRSSSLYKKTGTLNSMNPLAAEFEEDGQGAANCTRGKRPFGLETIQSQLELTIEDVPATVNLDATSTEFAVNGDDWDEAKAPPGAYRVSSGRQDRRVSGFRDSLRWSTRGSVLQPRQSHRASNRSSISSWMSSFTQSFASSPGEPLDIWRRLSAVTPRTKADLVENDGDVPHAEPCPNGETTTPTEDRSNDVKCRRWTVLSAVVVLSALVAGTGIGIILSRAAYRDSQETVDDNVTGSNLDIQVYPSELIDDIVHESFHAVMWGQVTNCLEMTLGDLQLHCPNGLVRVIDSLDSQCERVVDDLSSLTCSMTRQREKGREGIVLFACGATADIPGDMSALSRLPASNTTQCEEVVATDGFTDIVGGHGGSFMSLNRFCADDVSTDGTLAMLPIDTCISGRSAAPAYLLAGVNDGKPVTHHYCFDANSCTAPVPCANDSCTCSMKFSMLEASDSSDVSHSCIFDAQNVLNGRDSDAIREQIWRSMSSVRAHRLPFLRDFMN